ncbi:MAG: GntR family transcriptional regulator [Aestuariivita sp.]|nr:GntR family transcriptional regulator [Aestuariivita sp.]MCY4203021.1 GntR family transcriptional regulator [Aestuariivita sp.]
MSNNPESRGQAAYSALLDALRAGTYVPGDRLREEEVATKFALSRTPVREALRRLESDGIVEHRPRIGAVIRTLSHSEVVELYEMRIVMERCAAELAAQHGSSAEFDALASLNDQIEAERNAPIKAVSINQEFHHILCLAARNQFLLQAAQALNYSLLLLGPSTYTDAKRIDEVVTQHRDIIAALRTGDKSAAGAAAETHLRHSLFCRLT